MANLDINQHTSHKRKCKMNAECVNMIIRKIGQDKEKYNQYMKISWNNLKIILGKIYQDREISMQLKIITDNLKGRFLSSNNKLNRKYKIKQIFGTVRGTFYPQYRQKLKSRIIILLLIRNIYGKDIIPL